MKNGTLYAKRVKQAFQQLKQSAKDPAPLEQTEPLEQLVLAQLSWEASPSSARRAFKQLAEQMIDLNEVRVSTIHEIASVIREFVPNSTECARGISQSLNGVFKRESRLCLDTLKTKGVREARQYLETLEGVSPYASASVLLWSLGGHAIPVSKRLLMALQKQELIDKNAEPAAVQSFLERHVQATEARIFCQVMDKMAMAKASTVSPEAAPSKTKKTATKKKTKKSPAQTSTPKKKAGRS